jgi:hypothetical protein
VDAGVKALRTAESYIQAGAYDFALLLVAIAIELATTRFVYAALRRSGVTKKQLDNVEKDLTFSIMLNTQIAALAPPERKPDPTLIADIDRIRKRRNDLMHKGSFDISRIEVYTMMKSATRYLEYISEIGASAPDESND